MERALRIRLRNVALIFSAATVLAFLFAKHRSDPIGMAASCGVALGLGVAAIAARHDQRYGAHGFAAFLMVLLMEDGWYWNVFGRGTGFFTANRVSAATVFGFLIISPSLIANRMRC